MLGELLTLLEDELPHVRAICIAGTPHAPTPSDVCAMESKLPSLYVQLDVRGLLVWQVQSTCHHKMV